jgi:hypothetical protein
MDGLRRYGKRRLIAHIKYQRRERVAELSGQPCRIRLVSNASEDSPALRDGQAGNRITYTARSAGDDERRRNGGHLFLLRSVVPWSAAFSPRPAG